MEQLPPPLFSSIVAFAVYDYSEDPIPKRLRLPTDALKTVALVCKSWQSLINDIVARSKLSSISIKFSSGSRSENLELRRPILERGSQILDLDITLGDPPFRGGGAHPFRTAILSTYSHKEFGIDWDVFFSRLPALKRLDLSGVQLVSRHVELILESAAKYCKNIESVVLAEVDEIQQRRVNFDSIFTALYTAMKTWRSSGTHRGLRQLTVPILDERNRYQSCKQFFENVMKFCPDVEYLDGYKKTLNELEKLTCRDHWFLTLQQWEEFNSKCTELREFHWVVVPFSDSFFRVFGKHIKPNLKKLTFAVNMLWEWGVYFDSLDEAAGITRDNTTQRPGCGFKAVDVISALKGCPALDELEIELYHLVDEDELDYTDPYDDFDTADFPEHEVLNFDIYDDKFCEALAKSCPLLTRFSIWEVAESHNSNLTPIRTFTDVGLVALAQLKYLSSMELRTINCTGNGVFEFLNDLSDEFTGERVFQICVGGHPSDSRLAFYNAVPELLMHLEARTSEELDWGRKRFVLRLMNSSFKSVEPEWSEQYFRGLERVVNNVKKMHPTLRLRITTTEHRGNRFKSIIELGLYTGNVEPSPWYGWDDEESNRNITFVNRGGSRPVFDEGSRLPVELRHPELLDPDSLPIDYELPADYFDDYGGYGDYGDYSDGDDDGYYDGNADELWE